MRQALKEVENGRNNTTSTPDQPAQQSDDTIDNQPALSESDHAFVIRATQLVIENISNAEFNINSLCQEMAMSRTLLQPAQIADRKSSARVYPYHPITTSSRTAEARQKRDRSSY